MANILMDTMYQNPSLKMKKKSVLLKSIPTSILEENDDEAERLVLKSERIKASQEKTLASTGKSRNLIPGAQLTAPEINERIRQCIKLSAENKINVKNAFSLEMIDFMTYMIKKQDSNMSNLMIATTSLDVSAKIYGFRVDSVYTAILKLMAETDKQEKSQCLTVSNDLEVDVTLEEKENSLKRKPTRKNARCKQKIFSTVEALRGSISDMKPSSFHIEENDHQTTDALYQVILPHHASSKFYLHQVNDVIVDAIEETNMQDVNSGAQIPKIDICHMEICPIMSEYSFLDCMSDDESDDVEMENDADTFQSNCSLNGVAKGSQFSCNINDSYLDIDNDNNSTHVQKTEEAEKITDFRDIVTANAPEVECEYSFINKQESRHWAGPQYWKEKNFKTLHEDRITVEFGEKVNRGKKSVLNIYYSTDIKNDVKDKFMKSKRIQLDTVTLETKWDEDNLILPQDAQYDITNADKLYFHPIMSMKGLIEKQLKDTSSHDDDNNVDYNDEDVGDYTLDVCSYDDEITKDDNDVPLLENGDELCMQTSISGDNLVTAPKLTNKNSLPMHIAKAKKIDMGQLTKSMWKSIIDKDMHMNNEEEISRDYTNKRRRFSEVYKSLPNSLSKINVEALSFPIAFVSLLHLANQKDLKIKVLPDMSDIIVEQA